MERILRAHNGKVLQGNQTKAKTKKTCSCRIPSLCCLNEECLTEAVVYKATIIKADERANRICYCHGASIQTPLAKPLQSVKHAKHETSQPKIAKYAWQLKENVAFPYKWEIERRCGAYKSGMRACDLCLSEKWAILKHAGNELLKKRSEFKFNWFVYP